MAAYNEIHNAVNGQTFTELKGRIWVALLIKARAVIADAAAPAERKTWAKNVFGNIDNEAHLMTLRLIASNSGLTVTQMSGVADNAVQTAVNNEVDAMYPSPPA